MYHKDKNYITIELQLGISFSLLIYNDKGFCPDQTLKS